MGLPPRLRGEPHAVESGRSRTINPPMSLEGGERAFADTRPDGAVAPIAAVPCRGLVTLVFQAEGSAIRHRRRNPRLGHAS